MDEKRQLGPPRATQDHSQAMYHPPSRGQQPTLVHSGSPRADAVATTPRTMAAVATAQVVKQSGPREVQVEVVQPSASEESVRALQVHVQSLIADRAQMVDWRSMVESQLATQEQRHTTTESKVAGFEQKWIAQQIDKLGEFLRSLQMQLTKCNEQDASLQMQLTKLSEQDSSLQMQLTKCCEQNTSLQMQLTKCNEESAVALDRLQTQNLQLQQTNPGLASDIDSIKLELRALQDAVQTQVARLQESNAERAKQDSIATAARVDLDMTVKDLRLHVDGQLKLQAAHDSAINDIQCAMKEQKQSALAVESELKGVQEVVHRSIAEHGILDRQEQQAEVLRSLQDELLSLQRQQRDASTNMQSLQSGVSKQQAELADMHESLVQEVGVVKSKLNDNLATLSATVRSQMIEVQQAEFKDIRRNMETKLEQQEEIVKALRGHLSTNEEKIEQLLTQSRGQTDGHAILDDVDALKKELLAQRSTQSSELEREADALHTHVHKAVTEEREARQLETAKCQAMLNSIQGELLKLSDDMKQSTRAMPTRHVLPDDLPPLECINSKTQLDKTLYIGPATT